MVPVKILLVEDEQVFSGMIALKLRRDGFEVSQAFDTKDLIAQLNGQFNLILLDIMMPGLDGLEICRLLRERADMKKVPIVFMSARGTRQAVSQALAAQADAYFIKPFSLAQLIQKIKQLTGNKEVAKENILIYATDLDQRNWLKNMCLCSSFGCQASGDWGEILEELTNREYKLLVTAKPAPSEWVSDLLKRLNTINAGRPMAVVGFGWQDYQLPPQKVGGLSFVCIDEISNPEEMAKTFLDIISRTKVHRG